MGKNLTELRPKLMIGIGVPLLLAFLVLGLVIRAIAINSIETSTATIIRETATRCEMALDDFIGQRVATLDSVGIAWNNKTPAPEDMNAACQEISKADHASVLLYSDPKGVMTTKDGIAEGFDASTHPWFKGAVAMGKIFMTEPYWSTVGGTGITVTLGKPMMQNGSLVAVIGLDVSLAEVMNLFDKIQIGETGSVFVLGPKGEFVYHHDHEFKEPSMPELDGGKYKDLSARLMSGKDEVFEAEFDGKTMYFASKPVGTTGWTVVVNVPHEEAFADVTHVSLVITLVSLIAFLILGGIVTLFIRDITTPMSALDATIGKIASGDLSHRLAESVRTDEIGSLRNSCVKMVRFLRDMVTGTARASEQIQTAFDLTKEQQAEVKKNVAQVKEAGGKFDTIAALIRSLTAEIEKIAVASRQTRTGAESAMDAIHRLHKVSHLIHQNATDVSALAEEQAAANTEIAASTGTLSTLAQELKKDVQKFKL